MHKYYLFTLVFCFVLFYYIYTKRLQLNEIKYNSLNIKKKNIVIDAFTYFQESLMLSIRLFRMSEFVDYFIIVTAEKTYSGLPLKISFSPFESLIEKYRNKIIFYNLTFPPYCTNPWCRENYQRIIISDVVKSLNPSNESLVLISDLDEIPTSDAMKYIIKNPPNELYMLSGYMYYYNYRHKFKESWPGVIVVKASNCNKNIQKYRDARYSLYKTNAIPIYPSLTHCSFCYKNISLIQNKLKSFAHSEFNKPPYTNREYLIKCIKSHLNFAFKYKFEVVEYNASLNSLPNDERFDYLKEEYGLI